MHEDEGLFCKMAFSGIKDKFAGKEKNIIGLKLLAQQCTGGLGGCSHRALGPEVKKRLDAGWTLEVPRSTSEVNGHGRLRSVAQSRGHGQATRLQRS